MVETNYISQRSELYFVGLRNCVPETRGSGDDPVLVHDCPSADQLILVEDEGVVRHLAQRDCNM